MLLILCFIFWATHARPTTPHNDIRYLFSFLTVKKINIIPLSRTAITHQHPERMISSSSGTFIYTVVLLVHIISQTSANAPCSSRELQMPEIQGPLPSPHLNGLVGGIMAWIEGLKKYETPLASKLYCLSFCTCRNLDI